MFKVNDRVTLPNNNEGYQGTILEVTEQGYTVKWDQLRTVFPGYEEKELKLLDANTA